MHSFQVIDCALFKVELFDEGLRCQVVLRVICIKDGLLELLSDGAFMEAGDVKAVEVCLGPEVALLNLLVVDDFISEGHDAEVRIYENFKVSFGREKSTVISEQ